MSDDATRFPSRAKALEAVRTLLAYVGDDPDREGLRDTPTRVLKAWAQDWGRGYSHPDPATLIKTFDAKDRPPVAPMVVVRDISFFSMCEHHMAPFFGSCAIAYVPNGSGLLGLSKFARIVDCFSRRLQVQERLTDEIADFLGSNLSDHVAVTMQATHLCMVSRGVHQANAVTVTSALRGNFFDQPETRAEFFAAAGQGGSRRTCC